MKHSESTFSGFGELKLYYQCWRPEGEPKAALAVVHGFGEHSGRYGNVVDWFVPRGYAVYAFDLRGHGRSPGPRGYINEWAEYREDVKAFLALVHEQEAETLPVHADGASLPNRLEVMYEQEGGTLSVRASGANSWPASWRR